MAMTTSMTRSRRAEGLHQSHLNNTRHPHLVAAANAKAQNNQAFAASLHRTKRQLDPSTRDFDPIIPKKARIAVEIPARGSSHLRTARDNKVDAKPPQQQPPLVTKPTTAVPGSNHRNPLPHQHAPPVATTTTTTAGTAANAGVVPNGVAQKHRSSGLTKHKEKVVNGLKHELHRLQAGQVDTKTQGRKLRSQEATRFKSELSAYFPDYDEVIGNEPKEERKNKTSPFLLIANTFGHNTCQVNSNLRFSRLQTF
jgi:hypothetical protein